MLKCIVSVDYICKDDQYPLPWCKLVLKRRNMINEDKWECWTNEKMKHFLINDQFNTYLFPPVHFLRTNIQLSYHDVLLLRRQASPFSRLRHPPLAQGMRLPAAVYATPKGPRDSQKMGPPLEVFWMLPVLLEKYNLFMTNNESSLEQ